MERHARFPVLVLERSGVCLPRQYRAFAGLAHGRQTHRFFDGQERYACIVDGPPSTETLGAERRSRTLRRDGGEVVWTIERTAPNRPMVRVVERWSLSAEARTLTVHSTYDQGGHLYAVVHVFTRRDDDGSAR
jgi:hypothetical protein